MYGYCNVSGLLLLLILIRWLGAWSKNHD